MHARGGGAASAGGAMSYPSAPAALSILRPPPMPMPLQHDSYTAVAAPAWSPSSTPPPGSSPTPSPPSTSPPRASQRRTRTVAGRAALLARQARVEDVYGHAAAPETQLKLQRAAQRSQPLSQPQTQLQPHQPHSHRQLFAQHPPANHSAVSCSPVPPLHSLMASSPSPPPALPSYPLGLTAAAAAAAVGVASPAATPGHGPWDGTDASSYSSSPDSSPNDFGSAVSSGWPVALGPLHGHAPPSREEKQGPSYPLGVFEHAQTYYMQQLLLQQHQQLLQRQALAQQQQQQQQQQQRSHRHESRPPSSSGNVPSDSPRARPGPDFAATDFSASPEAHFDFSRRTAPKPLQGHAQGHAASKPRSSKRSSLPAPLNSPADAAHAQLAWRDHAARSGSSNHSVARAHPYQQHGHGSERPEAQLQHARRSVQGGSRRQRSADWATSSPRALHAPGPLTDPDPDPFPPRERGGASFQCDSDSEGSDGESGEAGAQFDEGHLALFCASPTSATSASDEASRWSRADELFIDDLAASFLHAPLPFARGTGAAEPRDHARAEQRRDRLRNGSGSGGARDSVRMPSQSPPRPCSSSPSAQLPQQSQQQPSESSFARRSADLSARVASLLRQEGGTGGNLGAEQGGAAKQRPRSTTGTRPAAASVASAAGSAGTRAHGNGWAHSRDTGDAGTAVSRAGSAPRMRASHGHSQGHGAAQPRPHHQPQSQQQQQARPQRPHSSSVLSPRSGPFASWSPSHSPSPSSAGSWHSSAGASSSSAAAAAEAAAIFASSEALSPRRATPARCRSAGFASPTATAPSRSAGDSTCPHSAAATVPPCTLASSLSAHGALFYAQLPPELWGLILGFLDSSAVLCRLGRVDRTGARVSRDPDAWVCVSFAGVAAAMASASATAAGSNSDSGGGGSDAALSLRASLLSATTTSRLLGLVPAWSCLRELDLSGLGSLVDDAFLARVVEAAGERVRALWNRGLERLSLARCGAVTDAGLRALAPCCGALRALDLSWVGLATPRGLAAMLERCGSTLERLVLNRCHALGDGGLRELARGASRLRELDLTFCGGVTDAGVAALTSPDSVCFRPRAARAPAEGQGEGQEGEGLAYPGLQRLCLRWCRQITDESVRLLCAPHPPSPPTDAPEADGIERANVASPPAFAGAGDGEAEKMRSCSLVSLNVDHCSLLTDASLLHLSKSATSLRSLSAVYCPLLTPASLRYLASGATTQLRSLVLDHCDQFRAYFATSNRAVLRSLLLPAGPAAAASASAEGGRVHPLAQLRLLSWRTCGHAGLERSRHAEIEAECCNGLAGPAAGGGDGGDDDDGGTAAGSDGNNVLDWIRSPSVSSSTPRSSPPPSARSRLVAARSAGARS